MFIIKVMFIITFFFFPILLTKNLRQQTLPFLNNNIWSLEQRASTYIFCTMSKTLVAVEHHLSFLFNTFARFLAKTTVCYDLKHFYCSA